MKINIIIPTYNSTLFVSDFNNKLNNIIKEIPDVEFKIIFIDDGSKDDTVLKLKELKKKFLNIYVIVLSKNFGQTNAILVGLEKCEADAYIVMAVDMQEPLELIYNFITSWKNGYKLCIAYRKYRTDNIVSKLFSKLFYFIINIDEQKIPKGGFDYGLIDKEVAQLLVNKPLNSRFIQGDLVNMGFPIDFIPCKRTDNSFTNKRLAFTRFKFNYFFDGIINTTRIPFRIIFILNFILSVFMLLLTGGTTISLLVNQTFTFKAIYHYVALLLISFLLLLVSVLIEFVICIYDIITKKTAYVIKEIIE